MSNRELKEANDNLQRFMSIIAHDLRAPLLRIDAFVGVLRQDFPEQLDEEHVDILTRIERASGRMRLMLEALLMYSKYGAHALEGKTADIATVVKDAMDNFNLAETASTLEVKLDGLPPVAADATLISHVVQNLISNSIKFRQEGRPLVIEIEGRKTAQEVEVAVTDNGIGIEPRFADRVFDMFCRLCNEDEYEGTGIGLAICRKIIHDHGGKIWVDPAHVGGTRVVFTLPREKEPKKRRARKSGA